MKIFLIFLVISISGCTLTEPSQKSKTNGTALIGSDRDRHNCISSAGYLWCAKDKQCTRPWELANQQRFQNSLENFNAYCENEDTASKK